MNKRSRLLKHCIREWYAHENLEGTSYFFILFEYEVGWRPRENNSIPVKNPHFRKIFMAYSSIFKRFNNRRKSINLFKIGRKKSNIELLHSPLSYSKKDMTYQRKATNEGEKNKDDREHRDFDHSILFFSSWQIFAPEYLYVNHFYASSSSAQGESHSFFDWYVCFSPCILLCIWSSSSMRLYTIFAATSARSKCSSFVCLPRSISCDFSRCDDIIRCLYNTQNYINRGK